MQYVNETKLPWFCLPPVYTMASCLAYSSTLKILATFSSETSVKFQLTTWRYIPEYSTLHDHRCENLKSYIKIEFSAIKNPKLSITKT
jgi:hypothetical protein